MKSRARRSGPCGGFACTSSLLFEIPPACSCPCPGCSRRASAFAIEQQLHLRRISYRREPVSGATASRLVIPSSALLRVPDLAQLLRPEAELRCAVEEDGRKRVSWCPSLCLTARDTADSHRLSRVSCLSTCDLQRDSPLRSRRRADFPLRSSTTPPKGPSSSSPRAHLARPSSVCCGAFQLP